MYDRADKESFTHRFYKQSSGRLNEADIPDGDSEHTDARFKQVEWFTQKNSQEAPTQGGVLELTASLLPRQQREEYSSGKPTTRGGKISST